MSRENWKRVRELLEEALERSPEKRDAFLDRVFVSEPGLQNEIESFLAHAEKLSGFLEDRPHGAGGAESLVDRTAPTLQALTEGHPLGDRYEIRARLGRGGMGEVWRAFDLKLRVEVALKALRPELSRDERGLDVLRREVRSAREVISPNVCRIFDLIVEGGAELVSMEYIDGITLFELLRTKGPLELKQAGEIAAQLLTGLDAIHRAGLVHRDLKPENVMVTRAGRVVVMDFGIAKPASEGGVHTVSGTPAYMAPEQLRGESVDARADVFSAGVVLAEMVSVEGVGDVESRETLWSGIRQAPPLVPDSPWRPVLLKAVAAQRDERYPTARALGRALEEVTLRAGVAEEQRPYPGLATFTETEAEFFYGREAEVEAIWKKLANAHLVAIIGPSGAGKSSFLRAGLLPARPEGWGYVICHPGDAPFASLARELVPELTGDLEAARELVRFDDLEAALFALRRWRRRHSETLVVLDQYEELFTQNDEELQSRFARLLGKMAVEADIHVLVSMRDDFLFRCHAQPELAPIFSALTPLGPPVGGALRRALVQPALLCGYRFEDEALADEMLREVKGERGALPLLAFAASRLWESRDRESGTLTRAAYRRIGGVVGSLAQHAEETLERIGSDREELVREVFRNLVTADGTRAARDREELLSVFDDRREAQDVLDALVDARLLTSFDYDNPASDDEVSRRVEIIHESLLSAWPRLVRWQTQDADGVQFRDQLRQAARLWQERDRAEDLLWTGSSVQEFHLWRGRYTGGLTATEEAFAGAMEDKAARDRKRRLFAVSAAFVLLLGVVAVVGVFWRHAVTESRRSEAAYLTSLGYREVASNPSAAVAYAIESLELADDAASRRLAVEALSRGPAAFVIPKETWAVGFSPDGQWLSRSGRFGELELWPRNGSGPVNVQDDDGSFRALEFTADSRALVSYAREDKTLRIWSVTEKSLSRTVSFDGPTQFYCSGEARHCLTFTKLHQKAWVQRLSLEGGALQSLGRFDWPEPAEFSRLRFAVDPTGTWMAFADGSRVKIARLDTLARKEPKLLGNHEEVVLSVAFHPDGERIATADSHGEIRLWSRSGSGGPIRRFHAPPGFRSLHFDPGGSRLASDGDDGTVRLWDLKAPDEADPVVLRLGEVSQMNGAAFDPSGHWLTAGSMVATALWPLRRVYRRVLRGHDEQINHVAFTPEGRFVASTSPDGTVRLWPVNVSASTESRARVLVDGVKMTWGLAVHPDGRDLLVGMNDGHVYRVSLEDGKRRVLEGPSMHLPYHAAYGPEGRWAAAGSSEGIRLWDLETGEVRDLVKRSAAQDLGDVRFAGAGRLITTEPGALRLWQLEDGTSRTVLEDPWKKAWAIDVSRDGRYLLSAGGDREKYVSEVVFQDLETGEARTLLSHGSRVSTVALDPTGTIAVTGDADGVVRVGPVSGEEPHLLFGHEGLVYSVAVGPEGRWIASGGKDKTLRLWPMPEGRPLHTLGYEELLGRLETLTNVRVVEDEKALSGYRLDVARFPGWE